MSLCRPGLIADRQGMGEELHWRDAWMEEIDLLGEAMIACQNDDLDALITLGLVSEDPDARP